MNKNHSCGSSGGSGTPAGLAGGAPDRPGAPLAGPAVALLLPLLQLLWYLIHSCSFIIYYIIIYIYISIYTWQRGTGALADPPTLHGWTSFPMKRFWGPYILHCFFSLFISQLSGFGILFWIHVGFFSMFCESLLGNFLGVLFLLIPHEVRERQS